MTERIERVKDALGIGNDRTDAGPDADRHDVERIEGDRVHDDRTPDAIPEDRLLGRDVDPGADVDDPATRHVDPSFAEPGYAEPGYAEPGYAEPGYARSSPAGSSPADPGYADPVATGDTTAWAASDSPAEAPTTAMAAATGEPSTSAPSATSSATASGADEGAWRDLQARFVDEPEAVTREAAVMVDQAVARLTQALAAAGGDGSTESLRHAFRRYREVYRTLTEV